MIKIKLWFICFSRKKFVFELWNVTLHTNVIYRREWRIMTENLLYRFQQGEHTLKVILL